MTRATGFDRILQLLHWIVAVLIVLLIAVHPSTEEGHADPGVLVMSMHIVVGMVVLFLVIGRIIWRLGYASLPPEVAGNKWQIQARKLTYLVFYGCMLLAPVLGIILSLTTDSGAHVYGLFEFPRLIDNSSVHSILRSLHGMTADILLYLGLLHTGVALYHQFYLKDHVLERMIK